MDGEVYPPSPKAMPGVDGDDVYYRSRPVPARTLPRLNFDDLNTALNPDLAVLQGMPHLYLLVGTLAAGFSVDPLTIVATLAPWAAVAMGPGNQLVDLARTPGKSRPLHTVSAEMQLAGVHVMGLGQSGGGKSRWLNALRQAATRPGSLPDSIVHDTGSTPALVKQIGSNNCACLITSCEEGAYCFARSASAHARKGVAQKVSRSATTNVRCSNAAAADACDRRSCAFLATCVLCADGCFGGPCLLTWQVCWLIDRFLGVRPRPLLGQVLLPAQTPATNVRCCSP